MTKSNDPWYRIGYALELAKQRLPAVREGAEAARTKTRRKPAKQGDEKEEAAFEEENLPLSAEPAGHCWNFSCLLLSLFVDVSARYLGWADFPVALCQAGCGNEVRQVRKPWSDSGDPGFQGQEEAGRCRAEVGDSECGFCLNRSPHNPLAVYPVSALDHSWSSE